MAVFEAEPLARRARHGGARRGLPHQRRRPPARGLGLGHHQDVRARRQGARARRRLRRDAGLAGRPLDLHPRVLLGHQGRAEEGHHGPARDAVRGARQVGRPAAARLDAAAHQRRGRDRALGVPGAAGVPHRRVVRPLGLGQPLRAQDALRREAHGGLLLLAREGVGRALPGPGRRHRRARRRGAHRHAGRAGGDRERPRGGRRDRPPAAHHPQRDLRGRGGRGRVRDLDPAGLERAAGGARAAPARLVRGPDQVPRPRRAAGRLGRPLHRHRRAGLRPLRARAVHLVPRPGHRRARASSST